MALFSEMMSRLVSHQGGFRFEVTDEWLQGRTTYGGLSAALCVVAAHHSVVDLPTLRSAQFLFVGPVAGQVLVRTKVVRRGKSSVIMNVVIEGESGVAVQAALVYGEARKSELHFVSRDLIAAPPPEECPEFFERSSLTFRSQFEARTAGGSSIASGSDIPEFLVWARHKDAAAGSSPGALLALADILPPPALALTTIRAPISTVTWTVDIVGATNPGSHGDWRLMSSTAESVCDGYSTQSMGVWLPNGEPLLFGRQHVAIFL